MATVTAVLARHWHRLAFLRCNVRLILFWPLAGTLAAVVAWAALLQQLDGERRVTDDAALKIVGEIAQAQAQRIERRLAMTDQMLAVVKMHWQMLNANIELSQLKGLQPSGSAFDIFILDANANLKMSTLPRSASADIPNLANQQFFAVQKNASSDLFFVGYPIKLSPTAATSINYSRRLVDQLGLFAGVAAITVDASTLVADYDEAMLGHRGLLEVIGSDFVSRAARIGQQAMPFALVPAGLGDLRVRDGGTRFVEGDRFADRRNRYLGWQAVAGYPLYALVGIDQQDYLAVYLERRSASLTTAVGATLALALLILVATFLSARLAWKNHQLQHAHSTYRIATEGGDDGFFITSVTQDGHGNAINFVVIDCNACGAGWFGYDRDGLIGTSIADWRKAIAPDALLPILSNALRAGKASGELQLRDPAQSGADRHLHLKAVRSGANLALTLQDITLQRDHLAMLERASNEDVLTGLPNRAWAQRFLSDLLGRAAPEQEKIGLLFLDLDGFKAVNDGLGHAAGDEVLKHASARLKAAIRPVDHLARLGGDEFIVIVRHVHDRNDAEHVARRILLAFCKEFSITQGNATLGMSIGISLFPSDASDVDTLLKCADVAMYEVKANGKNNFGFFSTDLGAAYERRRQRESELRRAIALDQFVMHYQPRIDLRIGEVTRLESLVRWHHPREGLIGPDKFIPLAEETGLILALGELIIDKVCRQVQQWQTRSPVPILPVSVNVSPRQLEHIDIPGLFSDTLRRYRIPAARIEVELHESALIKQTQQIAASVTQLQQLGIRMVVDDYGIGYTALSTLHDLKFDAVKIHPSLVRLAGLDSHSDQLLSAIIAMLHALGTRVVAEGVEDERQVRVLRDLGCDEAQGYWVARPAPAPATQAELLTRARRHERVL
jgi:diguanylate cyclase (GGDEF)-like protein